MRTIDTAIAMGKVVVSALHQLDGIGDVHGSVDALRTVANGGTVLGPTIGAAILAATHRTVRRPRPPFDLLTARELSIIGHLASGQSNARIARLLGLSEKTVRNQLSAAFTKLAVTDRVQAALLARDAGIGPDETRDNGTSP
jgi:DNA-binding NarL/FixJ family response regulator